MPCLSNTKVWIPRNQVGHLVDGDARSRDRPCRPTRSCCPCTRGCPWHRAPPAAARWAGADIHLAGRGIESPDQVAELPGPPDGPIGRLDRIARPLAERGITHFLNVISALRARACGHSCWAGIGRKILRDRGLRLGLRGQVDHRADQFFPAVMRVAQLCVIMLV